MHLTPGVSFGDVHKCRIINEKEREKERKKISAGKIKLLLYIHRARNRPKTHATVADAKI